MVSLPTLTYLDHSAVRFSETILFHCTYDSERVQDLLGFLAVWGKVVGYKEGVPMALKQGIERELNLFSPALKFIWRPISAGQLLSKRESLKLK